MNPSSYNSPNHQKELPLTSYGNHLGSPGSHSKNYFPAPKNSFGYQKNENEKQIPTYMHSSHIGDADLRNNYKNSITSPTITSKQIGSPRPKPNYLESKNNMKASMMMDDFGKGTSSTHLRSPKRAPRMSQHYIPSEMKQFHSDTKIPPFLSKNEKQSGIFKKKNLSDAIEKTGGSSEKDNRRTQASSFRSGREDIGLMKKSSYDPTSEWIKQSMNKKKQREISIADFQQIKELGAGKYGKVYLVREKHANFICALKMIEKKLLRQEEITEQFIRELKIQLFLNHPNIIRMYGYFHDSVNIYIILEVGTGGQLFKQLKKSQPMSEARAAGLLRQVCQAINELHSNQIIHRDLKPQNIVMSENIVKLCDFGWSVHMDKNLRTTFCGTPLYVCPEILRGKDYDQKIDIWSLGVMMYEILVGENPFKITKEDELIKIVKDAVVIPSYVELSHEAKDFLDCCLQKNPDQRSNIRELLNHSFFKKYPDKNDKKMGI